jgi:hypothetical protein
MADLCGFQVIDISPIGLPISADSLSSCAVRDLCNPRSLFLPILVGDKALLAGGVFLRKKNFSFVCF